MNWIKKIIGGLSYVIFPLICAAVILEVIFRILPTSDSLLIKSVSSENPVMQFSKNREITRQVGFNFQHVVKKRINNYGYASDKNFQEKAEQNKPVISIIGDSYVEALQVENKNTFHAILDKNLDNYDVYPMGASGSPLSQYLAFAKYASERFNPKLYIFLIISNDFDESFLKRFPGFHYFDESTELKLVSYEPSIIKRLARQSAFLRYLYIDLKWHVPKEYLDYR